MRTLTLTLTLGLGVSLFGLALGGIGGVLLAMILIWVINLTFFGWTIAVYWPWGVLISTSAVRRPASVGVNVTPTLQLARGFSGRSAQKSTPTWSVQ